MSDSWSGMRTAEGRSLSSSPQTLDILRGLRSEASSLASFSKSAVILVMVAMRAGTLFLFTLYRVPYQQGIQQAVQVIIPGACSR